MQQPLRKFYFFIIKYKDKASNSNLYFLLAIKAKDLNALEKYTTINYMMYIVTNHFWHTLMQQKSTITIEKRS